VNLSPDRARRPRCERGEEKAHSHSPAYGKGFRQSPATHIVRRGDGRGWIHSLSAHARRASTEGGLRKGPSQAGEGDVAGTGWTPAGELDLVHLTTRWCRLSTGRLESRP